MTLRGRLTTAFLVVVLGPVLLGSFFVAVTVSTVSQDRTVERLDHAATTVRTAIGAVCRQLQAAIRNQHQPTRTSNKMARGACSRACKGVCR